MRIDKGDVVVFNKSVIQRSRHSEFSVNFIGTVAEVFGGVCDVETVDGIIGVPCANLVKRKTSSHGFPSVMELN